MRVRGLRPSPPSRGQALGCILRPLDCDRTPTTSVEALAEAANREALLLEVLRRGGPSTFLRVRLQN